jgi:hypothetical protein
MQGGDNYMPNITSRKGLISPIFVVACFAIVIVAFAGFITLSKNGSTYQSQAGNKVKGNGAPSGTHYNLNIIGVSKDKNADMAGSEGHRIFVNLEGKTKINLSQGAFSVTDANGTDGNGASFQLPNPDQDGDGQTAYMVWARALGKPGGRSSTTVCALDVDGTEWCSVESVISVRTTGKSSFSDVSKNLLSLSVDLDGNGIAERYSLFDPALQGYFWDYDNQGLKLVQLRFYETPISVN